MIEIKDEHISTLLLKKIIGSISPNEEMELDAWRKESEKNETLYQKMLDHEYIERQLRQRSLHQHRETFGRNVSTHHSYRFYKWCSERFVK